MKDEQKRFTCVRARALSFHRAWIENACDDEAAIPLYLQTWNLLLARAERESPAAETPSDPEDERGGLSVASSRRQRRVHQSPGSNCFPRAGVSQADSAENIDEGGSR